MIYVAGALCDRCNRGLGRFEWNDDVMRNAINYMRRRMAARERLREEFKNGG